MKQSFKEAAEEIDALVAQGREGEGLVRVEGFVSPDLRSVYMIEFSAEEVALLRRKAKREGMSFSDYVKRAALTNARTGQAGNKELMTIAGIGADYSELLDAAGIPSLEALAAGVPGDLARKIAEINSAKRLVRRVPTEGQVRRWIAYAKSEPLRSTG